MLYVPIDGERIAAVTPALSTDTAGAAVVHAEGQYLIPGLIDSDVQASLIRCGLSIRIWWKPTYGRSRVPKAMGWFRGDRGWRVERYVGTRSRK
jgi:hypothetical protein